MNAGYLNVPVTASEALAVGRDVYYGHGKIEILPKITVGGLRDMAVSYTPGVGHVVKHLLACPEALHEQAAKDNMIALISDGTAVLGYGNVGPHAGIPVMEGKAAMFKMLAGIDCMPLCVSARGPQHLIDIIGALEPTFGGFNIEDVAAPHCFTLMHGLSRTVGVPSLHDDQFGTATVVTAALINAFAVLGRKPESMRVVVSGIGAAGSATITMLEALGVGISWRSTALEFFAAAISLPILIGGRLLRGPTGNACPVVSRRPCAVRTCSSAFRWRGWSVPPWCAP